MESHSLRAIDGRSSMSYTECGLGGTVCPKSLGLSQLFSAFGLQPPFPLSISCAASPKSNSSHSFVSVISLGFPQPPDTEAQFSGQAEKPL